jgi:hypothetical protein
MFRPGRSSSQVEKGKVCPINRPRRLRRITPLFNIGARWECVITATPALLTERRSTVEKDDSAPGTVWTGAEDLAHTGICF